MSRLSAVRLCVVPVTLWDLGKHQLLCYVLNRKVSPKLALMWGHLTLTGGLLKNHNRAMQEWGQTSHRARRGFVQDWQSALLSRWDRVKNVNTPRPAERNVPPAGPIIPKTGAAPKSPCNGYKLPILFLQGFRPGELKVNWSRDERQHLSIQRIHWHNGCWVRAALPAIPLPLKQELVFNCHWNNCVWLVWDM